MSEYKIFTDSAADLTPKLIKEIGIEIIPLTFHIDDMEYDDGSIDPREFYDMMHEGKMSTTSQINPSRFIETFEPVLRSGQDIISISLSSGISGTYNSSLIAAKQLLEQYPERKIICIDSLCASLGEGLLVYYATLKKKEGADIDQVARYIEVLKTSVCHWFTVDDLNHLKRGGRVSTTAAFVGGLLGIKPVMHVDDSGKLVPIHKVRGRRQSLDKIIEQMSVNGTDFSENTVFISHADCFEDAEYLAEAVKSKFSPKRIEIGYVGSVVGSHGGIGTLALFFIGNKR